MLTSQISQRPPTFQINKLWAKNFRSIADTSLDLGRLTVLVGPNASGKSNLLDVLRFLKDALRFDLEAAISLRHGVGGVLRHEPQNDQASVEIGLIAGVRAPSIDTLYSVEYGFSIIVLGDGQYAVSAEYGTIWDHEGTIKVAEFRIEHGNLVSPMFLANPKQQSLFGNEDNTDFDRTELAFPILLRMMRRSTTRDLRDNDDLSTRLMYDGFAYLRRNLLDMRFYHIFPNTIRAPQELGSTFPLDEDARNLASVLRDMEKERPYDMVQLKEQLARLIPGISDVAVIPLGGYLVVRLKHKIGHNGSWCDLSQESDGTVRLLGLLTALHQRRSVSLIGIEEPELTVHPGALPILSDLLNAASRRSQVVITTHSPDFIDCVTDHRVVETLRIVEAVEGATTVTMVSDTKSEAVKKHLFSPGELHRMGELSSREQD